MLAQTSRILIADDMNTMRAIIKQAFETIGFRNLELAKDGKTAWQALETSIAHGKPFSLVVSDWNMPEMDGLQLLSKMRAHTELKAIPFVMLTAASEKPDMDKAKNAGVNGFISKPFTPKDLQIAVASLFK